jgi:tetratricopeptide (TPR) repeat protein
MISRLAMLSVLAYLRAAQPSGDRRLFWSAVSFLCYIAALLCKAAAACLPLVLLVLDIYPLRRIPADPHQWLARSGRRAWLEKVPFAAVGLSFLALAVRSRQRAGWMTDSGLHAVEVCSGLAQASYGILFYLRKTACPLGLSAMYPIAEQPSFSRPSFILCGFVVITVSCVLYLHRRRLPGLFATWIAFVALLIPTLGIVRASNQIAADRYSYLPSICLAVPLAWQLRRWVAARTGSGLVLLGIVSFVVLLTSVAVTRQQCRSWRSSEALWRHAIAQGFGGCAEVNYGLADALGRQRLWHQAIAYYRRACEIEERLLRTQQPLLGDESRLGDYLTALGNALLEVDDPLEAAEAQHHALVHQRSAISKNGGAPALWRALSHSYFSIGKTQDRLGQPVEALKAYETALAIRGEPYAGRADDDDRIALALMEEEVGSLCERNGRPSEAVAALRRARNILQDLTRRYPRNLELRSRLNRLSEYNREPRL